tara:strand:- start:738 stop:1025 length:288 start_codon:yes stop_codon:yes gene_type:complete
LGIVKSDLLKQFRDNFPNFQKKDLNKIFEIFVNEIKNSLKKGESVEIRSFGRFSIKIHKDKLARNPKTGEKIKIPQKKIIRFKMAKEIFNKINDK